MRILGFSKHWEKLNNDEFTTFRFPREDKDWEIGERVQVFYKPRSSKNKQYLGVAEICNKEERPMYVYNIDGDREAQEDGFANKHEMLLWLNKVYGKRWLYQSMNRLTLRWVRPPHLEGDILKRM